MDDLDALIEAGWRQKLDRHLRYGGKLIGICGGYQMLGQSLVDPLQIESTRSKLKGFAYFDAKTQLHPEKQLRQVSGRFVPGALEVCAMQGNQTSGTKLKDLNLKPPVIKGYEIHCGITEHNNEVHRPLLALEDGNGSTKLDGAVHQDNNIIGTYMHGLFDQPTALCSLLNWAGLDSDETVDLDAIREAELDRLADSLETCLRPDFLDRVCQ